MSRAKYPGIHFDVTSSAGLQPNNRGKLVDILPQHAELAREAQAAFYAIVGSHRPLPTELSDIPIGWRVKYVLRLVGHAHDFERLVPDDGTRAQIIRALGYEPSDDITLVISTPVV